MKSIRYSRYTGEDLDIGAEDLSYLALNIPTGNIPTIPKERAAECPHHLIENAACKLASSCLEFVAPLLDRFHEQMGTCRSRGPSLQPDFGMNVNMRKPLCYLSQMRVEPFISAFVFPS